MDVGAGDVHLEDSSIGFPVHTLAYVGILVYTESAHVGEDRSVVDGSQGGHLMVDYLVDARVLQTNCIQHAASPALGYSRQRIAVTRFAGRTFGGDGPQYVQVHPLAHLPTKTASTAGRNNGVLQQYVA